MSYPNAGLTRSFAHDLTEGRHPCEVEGCYRPATHAFIPKAPFTTFVPFRKGQRSVVGPMVCEIDAILIECDLPTFARYDETTPNSDPKAPRWEDTVPAGRRR